MIKNSKNNMFNKEYLFDLLQKYRTILSRPIIDYLESLIELEISVISDYIDDIDRQHLRELELYRKVAIYNIYNRVLSVIGNNSELSVYEYDGGLKITTPKYIIFNLDYSRELYDVNIVLNEIINNQRIREKELLRMAEQINFISNEKNPFNNVSYESTGIAASWELCHKEKIRILEEKFRMSASNLIVDEENLKQMTNTSYYVNLLLKDFKIYENDFGEQSANELNYRPDNAILTRTFVKRIPGITIEKDIKYY